MRYIVNSRPTQAIETLPQTNSEGKQEVSIYNLVLQQKDKTQTGVLAPISITRHYDSEKRQVCTNGNTHVAEIKFLMSFCPFDILPLYFRVPFQLKKYFKGARALGMEGQINFVILEQVDKWNEPRLQKETRKVPW